MATQVVCYRYLGTGSCTFNLHKKFSEVVVGCLASDSVIVTCHVAQIPITLSSSLESFLSLGNLCKLTPPA